MVNKKTVKLSFRIGERLAEMLYELCPLFDNNLTETLEYVLINYLHSPDYFKQRAKVEDLRAFLIALEQKYNVKK